MSCEGTCEGATCYSSCTNCETWGGPTCDTCTITTCDGITTCRAPDCEPNAPPTVHLMQPCNICEYSGCRNTYPNEFPNTCNSTCPPTNQDIHYNTNPVFYEVPYIEFTSSNTGFITYNTYTENIQKTLQTACIWPLFSVLYILYILYRKF
jgi:hypothetical protein